MQSAQVVSGIINGVADDFYSANALRLLPIEKIDQLTSRINIQTKPYYRVFLNELVTAAVMVYPADPDRLKRDGIVNHTVIHKFDSTIEHDGYLYQFPKDQFEKDARIGKLQFKMPPLPTEIKKPLDNPPPPEWEVYP
jgi:hypothetical protein